MSYTTAHDSLEYCTQHSNTVQSSTSEHNLLENSPNGSNDCIAAPVRKDAHIEDDTIRHERDCQLLLQTGLSDEQNFTKYNPPATFHFPTNRKNRSFQHASLLENLFLVRIFKWLPVLSVQNFLFKNPTPTGLRLMIK